MDLVNAQAGPGFQGFHTTDKWVLVYTETAAVSGIAYSIAISAAVAAVCVYVFTGSWVITVMSILMLLCNIVLVFGCLYLAGWELGVVEALSLSILLGISIDFLFHMGESYLHAGNEAFRAFFLECYRRPMARYDLVQSALTVIGVSILNSGLTTVLATCVLVAAQIDIIRKIGLIVMLTLAFSTFISLAPFPALLATCGPAHFVRTRRKVFIAVAVCLTLVGIAILVLYILSTQGTVIETPRGEPLFP